MKCNTPGFPVLHYLPELAQTHVHWVSDAIQPPHSASGSFPMSLLFESGGQSTGASALASVLPVSIQGWFPLGSIGLISLLSRVFSNTAVQKHQSFSTQLSLQSNSDIRTWLLEKSYFWLYGPLLTKWYLGFLICCLGLSYLFLQGTSVFYFMAAVTVCSDFGALKRKINLSQWWNQVPWC